MESSCFCFAKRTIRSQLNKLQKQVNIKVPFLRMKCAVLQVASCVFKDWREMNKVDTATTDSRSMDAHRPYA